MTQNETETAKQTEQKKRDDHEGNVCVALGAGVGALGFVSAAVTGALCSVCVVAVPGLLGVGAYKKWKARKAHNKLS